MKRKKSFLKKITLLFVLFFLIHVGHTFVTNDAVGLPEKLQGFGTIKQEEHPIASDKYGWELVLVNRDNYIPDDYEMDLMELSNGQKIDSRIYPYLQEMFDDARNAGVYPFVRDGYRTAEEQQQILDDKIAAYRSEGYTKHMAEETAMEWVALPGASEHQLGLAVDINADRIDDMKEIPHLICGKTAVGGNYNLTRDSIAVKIKKSAGALKHRRTFALLFCQSKNQTITESDALHGSQHQQAPELWRDQYHPEIPHQWWKQPGDSSGEGHLPEYNLLPCCKYPL